MDTTKTFACLLVALLIGASACSSGEETEAQIAELSARILQLETEIADISQNPDQFRGPQGETGSQGPQGDTGLQGETSPQGETGSQGPQGDTGLQGETGSQGERGYTGSTGPRGWTGSQGERGYTGSTGPQGPKGSASSAAVTSTELSVCIDRLASANDSEFRWSNTDSHYDSGYSSSHSHSVFGFFNISRPLECGSPYGW